ncbi:hypothetical protein [Luteolibacter luteus]|uniref:Uncharacterized protein n=1 Tax=Luteolibacter luteus TaxID=2728835 RepID=A0A858RP18_9BACT|nr:hypothetical protein [Luteolibacter luteus]QJE98602.1 hypothetical protein HHL09_23400 [Luteolibacter luteus]
MNTPNDEEIEALLGKLAPAPPAPALMMRLRAARPRPVILRPIFWGPLAAVAAAVVTALTLPGNEPAKAREPQPELANETPKRVPVASKQHLMEVIDLGVVRDADQPVRLIRTTWLDEIYYASTTGGQTEKESQIREEVMPVALTTY